MCLSSSAIAAATSLGGSWLVPVYDWVAHSHVENNTWYVQAAKRPDVQPRVAVWGGECLDVGFSTDVCPSLLKNISQAVGKIIVATDP